MIHCVLNMNQQGNCKRSDIVFGSIPVAPGRHDRMDPEISGQLQYYAQGHQVYTSISIVSLCNVDEGAQIPYQNRFLSLVASYKTPPEGTRLLVSIQLLQEILNIAIRDIHLTVKSFLPYHRSNQGRMEFAAGSILCSHRTLTKHSLLSRWLHTSPVSSILWLRTSISLRVVHKES